MKKLFLLLVLLLPSEILQAKAWNKINIFACTPEWASLAKEIVGDQAIIFTATNANQDLHFIKRDENFVKSDSNLLNQIRNTNLVFCTGAGLESAWLDPLLKQSSRDDIKDHAIGSLMASDYVTKLKITDGKINPDVADVHPLGNPHIHLNPHNISLIAAEFLKRILVIDPDNAIFYQKNYDDFMVRWNQSIATWEKEGEKLKKMPIVINHDQWAYMVDWLGLKVVAKMEEKPGAVPSKEYMAKVIKNLKTNPAAIIIYGPSEDGKVILWMRHKTRTPIVLLPYTIGGNPKVKNLFDLFDFTIKNLELGATRKIPSVK